MKNEFYQEERVYHIYTIYDPYAGSFYVGKTSSADPQTRFRAHLRGECQLTAESFIFSFDPDAIRFCLLESIICTGSDAYRHVVAWCHYFKEQGFPLLNAAGTAQDAENLHPQTQAIYDTVCAPVSLEHVLTREVMPLQREPDSEPYESRFCYLNMRVPEDTRDAFTAFCEQNAVIQRDGLRLLLLTQEELDCQRLACAIQAELAEKGDKIAELEAALEKKKDYIKRMKDRNAIIVETCKRYAREAISRLPAPKCARLRAVSFNTSKRMLDFASYSYPSGSGCDYFTPEHLVYGKGVAACLFVLGRTASGERIKLRWYDRDSYVGSTFKRSAHAYKDTLWLVGYTTANDGAVDLVAAIPLGNDEPAALRESTPDTRPLEHPSFSDIIKDAEAKKKR